MQTEIQQQRDVMSIDFILITKTSQLHNREGTGTRLAHCTANNTHVTVTQVKNGRTFKYNGSTGLIGFKGTKRGTPHAAEQLTSYIAQKLVSAGVMKCHVVMSGPGRGRTVIVKTVLAKGREILSISEGNSEAHNGCRPKKARRV